MLVFSSSIQRQWRNGQRMQEILQSFDRDDSRETKYFIIHCDSIHPYKIVIFVIMINVAMYTWFTISETRNNYRQ